MRFARPIDLAYLGIGVGAAGLLQPEELVFITSVCIANHGLSSLMREVMPHLLADKLLNDETGPNQSFKTAAGRSVNMKIRRILGGVFYSLALACLHFGTAWKEYGKGESTFALLAKTVLRPDQQRAESLAILISMAFLFFDHIYAIFFCAPPKRGSWGPIEDLTSLAVLLFVQASLSGSAASWSSSASFSNVLALWLIYRVGRPLVVDTVLEKKQHRRKRIRVAMSKKDISPASTVKPKRQAPTKGRPITLLSDKVMMQKPPQIDKTQLWEIDGSFYDLSAFVNKHPGGKEALLLGRGRDCTALFESYHPFSKTKCRQILEKHRVAKPTWPEQKTTETPDEDFFYNVLCQRVAMVLREKGVDPILNRGATYARSAYYLLIASAVFISAYYHAKGSVLGSFLLGAFGWLIGALGHDAGHFSASRFAWVNDIGVWGMTLLCNPIVWQHQHTYAHHSFTNDFDHDPDLLHFDVFIRIHRRVKHQPIFRNQTNALYVILAYTLVVFGTCFWIPITMIRDGSLYGVVEWTDRKRQVRSAGMFLHLLGYFLFIMVLPFWTMQWYWAFAAVTTHLTTSGLSFAFFSQINHINEASLVDDQTRAKREASRDPRLLNSWAVEQVETSNNFCTGSFAWHIISNGLNLQIEHHLFPGLNHCHLHLVAPIVRETCREFGVQYKVFESWTDIFQATLDWLDKLADGNEGY